MPSIHKRTNSPYYVAAYYGPDGRRMKKSTKTANRMLAMKLSLEWEQAAMAGRKGRLTESQCRRVLSEIHEQSTGESLVFYTAGDWLEEWLTGKRGAISERSALKYKQYVAELRESLGDRDKAPLNAISSRDIRKFRDSLAEAGHSPSTVNGALKILSGPFNAALRFGYIPINPCVGVEQLRDEADTEKDVFTTDQIRALLGSADDEWKGVILMGFYTGLRLEDVANMRWESIDSDDGLFRVKTGKTGAVVSFPLHAEIIAWLRKQTRGIGKAPIFPSLVGKTGGGRNGLSMKFSRIMDQAGVVGRILRERKENSAGRTQRSLTFHSLRHSFNSALANAGVAQELRQKFTGHASAKMNARYTHHGTEALRAAVAVLPRLGEKT